MNKTVSSVFIIKLQNKLNSYFYVKELILSVIEVRVNVFFSFRFTLKHLVVMGFSFHKYRLFAYNT